MKELGKMNGVEIFFSHGTHHSKGVCILIDLCNNKSGRIVLQFCLKDRKFPFAIFTHLTTT